MIRQKRRVWSALTIGILLAASLAYSTTGSLLEQAKGNYGEQSSVRTKFTLDIFWKVRQKTEHKKGTLLLGKGDKFRVRLDHTEWVSDGYTYWQYSKKSNQVVIKNLLDLDVSYHPSMIFSHYLKNESYVAVDTTECCIAYTDSSLKSNKKSQINEITIWIRKEGASIEKIKMVDENGNISTYTFNKWKFGVQFSEDDFTFEPPQDARILDTRA